METQFDYHLTTVLASGTLGTATWKVVSRVNSGDKLEISGGTVNNVMFYRSRTDSGSTAPWYQYDDSIKEVDIIGHLVLAGSMVSFLANFNNCTTINGLTNVDTSQVTDFRRFFDMDTSLTSLDLSSFSMQSVKDGYSDDASANGATYGESYMLSILPSALTVYLGFNTKLESNAILDPHGAATFNFVQKN